MPPKLSSKKPYTNDGVHFFVSKVALRNWEEYKKKCEEQKAYRQAQSLELNGPETSKSVLSSAGASLISRDAIQSRGNVLAAIKEQNVDPRMDTRASKFHIERKNQYKLSLVDDDSIDFWPSTSFHGASPRPQTLESGVKFQTPQLGQDLKFADGEKIVFQSFDLSEPKRFSKHTWLEEPSSQHEEKEEVWEDMGDLEGAPSALCGVVDKANGRGRIQYPQCGQVRRGEIRLADNSIITTNYYRIQEQLAREEGDFRSEANSRGTSGSGRTNFSHRKPSSQASAQHTPAALGRGLPQDPRKVHTGILETRLAKRPHLPQTRIGIGSQWEGAYNGSAPKQHGNLSIKRMRDTSSTGSTSETILEPKPKRVELVPEANIFLPDDHTFSLIRRMFANVALGAVKFSFEFWRDELRALKARERHEWGAKVLRRFYLHFVRGFIANRIYSTGVEGETSSVRCEIRNMMMKRVKRVSFQRMVEYKTRVGVTQDGNLYYWSEDELAMALARHKKASQHAMNAMNRMIQGKVMLAFNNWYRFVTFEMGRVHSEIAENEREAVRVKREKEVWHPSIGIRCPKPLPAVGAHTGSNGRVAVDDISRYNSFKAQHCGPTDTSSWLFQNIHVKFLFGAYPRGQAHVRDRRVMARSGAVAQVLLSGIDTYVSLLTDTEESMFRACHPSNADYRTEVQEKHKEIREELLLGQAAAHDAMVHAKDRADRGRSVGYGKQQQMSLDRVYESRLQEFKRTKRAVDEFPSQVHFLRLATPFGGCASDGDVLELVQRIENILRENRKVFVFSSDGKGRAGVVSALVLGRLYGLKAHEALERILRHHMAQERYKKDRNGSAADEAPACPQYAAQKQQVFRILSHCMPMYSSTVRRGLVEMEPGMEEQLVDERVRERDREWKRWSSSRVVNTSNSSRYIQDSWKSTSRTNARKAITLAEVPVITREGAPQRAEPKFNLVEELEEEEMLEIEDQKFAMVTEAPARSPLDSSESRRSMKSIDGRDSRSGASDGGGVTFGQVARVNTPEESSEKVPRLSRGGTAKLLSGRSKSIRRVSELERYVPIHKRKSRKSASQDEAHDEKMLEREVEQITPWESIVEDSIVEHKIKYSFENGGYTVWYLVKNGETGKMDWNNRADLIRDGSSMALKMVDEYEAGPAREDLEKSGFQMDIKYDIPLLHENVNIKPGQYDNVSLASFEVEEEKERQEALRLEEEAYREAARVKQAEWEEALRKAEEVRKEELRRQEHERQEAIRKKEEERLEAIRIAEEKRILLEQAKPSDVVEGSAVPWESVEDCHIVEHRSRYSISSGYSLMYLVQRGIRRPQWVEREVLLSSPDENALQLVGKYEFENETELEDIGFDTEMDKPLFSSRLADLAEADEEGQCSDSEPPSGCEDNDTTNSVDLFSTFDKVKPWHEVVNESKYEGRILAHRSQYSIETGFSLAYQVDEGGAEPRWISREALLTDNNMGKLHMVEEYEIEHEQELESLGFSTDAQYDEELLKDHPAFSKLKPFAPNNDLQAYSCSTQEDSVEAEFDGISAPSEPFNGSKGRTVLCLEEATPQAEKGRSSLISDPQQGPMVPKLKIHRISFRVDPADQ